MSDKKKKHIFLGKIEMCLYDCFSLKGQKFKYNMRTKVFVVKKFKVYNSLLLTDEDTHSRYYIRTSIQH